MIEPKKVALLAAVIMTILTFYVGYLIEPPIQEILYFPTVVAGISGTCIFAFIAHKAWGQEPPGEMVAWVFGHLTLWAAAFSLQEMGWWFLKVIGSESPWFDLFTNHFAPILEVVQATAILGLLIFAWLSHKGFSGNELALRLRLTWFSSMAVSAIGFLVLNAIYP